MNRRDFLGGVGVSFLGLAAPNFLHAQEQGFSEIWTSILADPTLAQTAAEYRDFALDESVNCLNVVQDGETVCIVTAARRPPRLAPSKLEISQAAKDLIIFYEVTNKSKYDRDLEGPIWPGGDSGITVGFGYDLGYVSKSELEEEWKGAVHKFVLERLSAVCGLKGQAARTALSSVSQVRIDWDAASRQFSDVLLPIFVAQTEKFLPNLKKLHPDCRGALVSLVFNRGTALTLKDDTRDTRKEMREIVDLMKVENYTEIPARFRDMTKVWEGQAKARGVVLRRRAEAALFEKGLQA